MTDTGIVRTGVTLAVIGALCAGLVALTWHATRERIAANERALLEQSLVPVLEGLPYDNDLAGSRLVIDPPHDLPGNDRAYVYRAFDRDEPVAALFAVTARDGYSGPIRVLVGVDVDGRITGVRILQHRETPGLGDRIDSSRSDWVHQFDGRSIGDPVVSRWAIRRDAGDFDQLTGASVTPRAVIKAIRDTLLYFDANRREIFQATAREEDQ